MKGTSKEQNHSLEYLQALDESKDNTRIVRYVFLLIGLFMVALFATHFYRVGEAETLLSSELIHFISGCLFTYVGVIVDRYFKSRGQKESERDMTYIVGKLKEQNQNQNLQ